MWCLAALVLVPFDIGDISGLPLSDVVVPNHLLGLLPPLATGHSSSDAGHDFAIALAVVVYLVVEYLVDTQWFRR